VVPTVREYVYLGCCMTYDLNLQRMSDFRWTLAKAKVAVLRPFLSNPSIPFVIKVKVLKGIVLPTSLYGAEVWGCNSSRLSSQQTWLNSQIRLIAGHRPASKVQVKLLSHELGLAPLHALASARRVRAYAKYRYSNTIVSDLMSDVELGLRDQHRQLTWMTGVEFWLKRALPANKQDLLDDENCTPRQVYWVVLEELTSADLLKNPQSLGAARYYVYEFARTRTRMYRAWSPLVCKWLKYVIQLRASSLVCAPVFAHAGYIDGRWTHQCPCCLQQVPESVVHFLVECPCWDIERSILVGRVDRLLRGSVCTSVDRWALTLGGVARGVSFKKKHWLLRPCENLEDAPQSQDSVTLQLLRFLASVLPRRWRILGALTHHGVFGRRNL